MVIDTEWRCVLGEIPFIARDSDLMLFIDLQLNPGETTLDSYRVPPDRQQRIRRCALLWLNNNPSPFRRVRFDGIRVMVEPGVEPRVEHIPAVF